MGEVEKKSEQNRVLRLYKQFSKYPFGKTLFSYFFSFHCPYFLTLGASIEDVKPGFGKFRDKCFKVPLFKKASTICLSIAQVSLKQRWITQNHIGTIHAIAVCNLIEMTMGLVVEASIPSHLRWLPMGMDVSYLKKSAKKVVATSSIDPTSFFQLEKYPGQAIVPIEVKDGDGNLVIKGDVSLMPLCNLSTYYFIVIIFICCV
jgi:acyl-coenzyme A thioesterase PaaI-like protein